MILIPLTQGMFAQIDDEDFERVSAHKWCVSFESRKTKYYAKRWIKASERERWGRGLMRMHHFILNITPIELPLGYVVDHIDNDSLNNQKSNLRIITQVENMKRCETWKKKVEEPFL